MAVGVGEGEGRAARGGADGLEGVYRDFSE